MTAPYWALNTRNDTLALLNLYPFEQYIHMERCKAEYDQMLCRPGCRSVFANIINSLNPGAMIASCLADVNSSTDYTDY